MNRLQSFFGAVLLAGLLAGCDAHDHDHGDHGHEHDATGDHADHGEHGVEADHHGHGDTDVPGVVVTDFTEHAELFVEFPMLRVGGESPFAAHFTWLDDFTPVSEGRVRVLLRGGGLPEEIFTVDRPSIPGIFRPVAVPAHAGQREVVVVLESARQVSLHALGVHTVYPDQAAIPAGGEEEEPGAISYLKEQQWQVDFATTPVARRTLRESTPAVATLKAAADGEAEISAPHDGQLARQGSRFPTVGMRVQQGDILGVVGSPLGRELGQGVSGTALRAPITGAIAHVFAIEGGYLNKGQPVLHIIDTRRLWLEARIPESDVLRMQEIGGAWVTLPGAEAPLSLLTRGEDANARVVAFSQMIDPRTRTAPLTLEFPNPEGKLPIGMLVQAHVYTGNTVDGLAIPVSAVVRDSGVTVVYVMLGGETFERRVVRLGIREGDYVEVRSGLDAGERVVSRGAYLVKLAASSPAEAGHGHAH